MRIVKAHVACTIAGVVLLAAGGVSARQEQPAAPAAPAPQPAAAPAEPVSPPVVKKNGLVIEDLVIGDGLEVKPGGAVVAHYVGTLKADGTEFDSSYKREVPLGFALRTGRAGVIQGWAEGVPGMKVGGKRRLTVPGAMGYAEKGYKTGDKMLIPPNADLVFEIELVDVLVIEDLKVGDGPEAKPGTAVVAHYKGTLEADGTEFDSSYTRGQPIGFPLDRVIKGWTEGVPGMKVGGKRKLVIPWALAYGAKGRPPKIPAKADLVFEIELASVLEIEDIKVGDGAEAPPGSTVKVHYLGTLREGGKKFDSSYDRGEPIEFSLGQVIQGWQYGIPGMKVGGKRKLVIPWQFAYGEQGMGADIPPKADLVFEVELLGVK